MFTGIVQKLAKIKSIDKQANLIRLGLGLGDLATGLELGASVAINGVCLRSVRPREIRFTSM